MATNALLDLQLKADSLETAHQVIHEILAGTRAFPGCLGVTVLVDSADPAQAHHLDGGRRRLRTGAIFLAPPAGRETRIRPFS